jgi:predicted RNase H-like HicB family nuclease
MEQGTLAFTAVYLKSNGEYFGFVEELPSLNARGRTLNDARDALQSLASEVFDEERRKTALAHAGAPLVREFFFVRAS